MKQNTYRELFLELAKPNKEGFSKEVPISKFVGRYAKLKLGNGGSWCREESSLARKYKIKRIKNKNKIIAIQLNGFNKNPITNFIKNSIKKEIRSRKCLILGTSNPETDHKNGRKNNPRVNNISTQKLSDFQPLSKAANDAKRQYCKDCKKTNIRFDAKRLGYKISYIKGSAEYKNTCKGCFWYDIEEFKQNI